MNYYDPKLAKKITKTGQKVLRELQVIVEKMEKFNIIKSEIRDQLDKINYRGDLADIGNEVGIIIAKYFDEDNTVKDFIDGLKHGISLTDGTHYEK